MAVAVALTIGYARRIAGNGLVRSAGRLASLGYAVPGTVLAIGPAHSARRHRQRR
ncbi:MAG: hypothetical protein WDN31_14250 [Hyphomicrobium sp.]